MDGDFIRKALLLLLANWKKDGLYYSPSYARPLTLALFSHLSNWRPQGMSGEYEDENGDRRRARASPLFTFHLSMGGGKGWREGRGTRC